MSQTSPESTSSVPSTNDASSGKLPDETLALLRLIHSFDPDLAGQISTFEKLRLSRNWDHLSAGSLKNIQLSTTSNASQDAKFIKQLPIPRYSSEPKDFGDSVDDGIFVWQHRLDLVNSIIDAVDMGTKIETDEFGAPPIDFKILPEQQRGMILSGPHGIGKSGMTRFIAAVAHMNDCFLFYVPYARKMFQEAQAHLEFDFKFAITTLIRFNYAKLCNYTYPVKEEGAKATYLEKLLKVTRYGPSTQVGETYEEVWNQCINFMVNMVEYPVVIVVDEHNELFKPRVNKEVPAEVLTKVGDFCSAQTFVVPGKRTFLVIAGSAHSKFEYKNDPTMKRWKQYLQPTPKDAFIAISRLQTSTNQVFPESLTNEAQIEERYNNFGGILRELKYYVAEHGNTADHIVDWMEARSVEICGELDAYYMKLPPAKQEQYITYLRDHLWHQSKIIEGGLYDQGFWYMERSADPKSTKWIAVPTCDPVRVALQTFSFLERGVTDPFSLLIPEEERGSKFQDCFRDALSFFGTTKLAVVDYGTRTASELCLGSTRMAYQVTSLTTPRPAVYGTCSFWLNGIENFPGFDFAWIDVVRRDICLISISISSIDQHEKDSPSPLMKAMSNSFNVGDHSVTTGNVGTFTNNSSSALLLSWLTGITWKTRYAMHISAQKGDKKTGKPPQQAVPGTLDAVMDPLPPVDQQWTVRFLFFSGQEEQSKFSNRLTNLLLAGPKTSAAFLHSPLHSVETYLNRLEERKAQKASKLRPPEELQEVHKPPKKKKAKLSAATETAATMDEDTDES